MISYHQYDLGDWTVSVADTGTGNAEASLEDWDWEERLISDIEDDSGAIAGDADATDAPDAADAAFAAAYKDAVKIHNTNSSLA